MEIVPLADRDEFIGELAELHHAEWNHFSTTLTLNERAENINRASGREGIPCIFIAISEGQLLGSAALVQGDMETKPNLSPWLAAVYVKEEYRHGGIATELITRCESEAAKSGATAFYLYTEFASKLYAKLGWNQMERCKYKGVMVEWH